MAKVSDVPPSQRTNPIGYCPQCGARGEWRERRPNGNDTCEKGHVYPSKDALSVADVVSKIEPPDLAKTTSPHDPGLVAQINRDDKTTEHEPMPVSGYKPQSQENIDLANEGKELEERVLRWLDKVGTPKTLGEPSIHDARMLALGKTNIQQGFMWAVRSIFQPGRIKLPEDQE